MASKAQIIDYIAENYQTKEGMPVSLPKLDGYKKADLEEFIEKNEAAEDLEEWVKTRARNS